MNFQSTILEGEILKYYIWAWNFQSTILDGEFSKYYFGG